MALVVDPKQYIVGAADIYYRPVVGGPWASVGATMEDAVARITQTWYAPDLNGLLGPVQEMDNLVSQIAEMEFTMAEIAGAKLALAVPGATATVSPTTDATGTPGSSTLAAPANIGDTVIKMTAVTNFVVGDYVRIGAAGPTAEYRQLDTVGTLGAGGTGLTFRDGLRNAHPTLDPVVETVGDGKTDITGTGIRRQPSTAYNQWAMVAQSPNGYYEFAFDSGISQTDAAEITFGDEATGSIRTTIQSRYNGATTAKAPWHLRVPA